MQQIEFHVNGMSCACEERIENAQAVRSRIEQAGYKVSL